MVAWAALGKAAMGGLKAGTKKVATDKLLNRKNKTNKRRASAKKIMGLEDEEKDPVIKPQNSLVPLSIKTTTIPTENLITTKGDSIKDKLFMIKDLLELQLKLRLSSWAETIKNRREERRKEREKQIEEKKQKKKKSPFLTNLLPKTGILDSLTNFLTFLAGGFLLNLLFKYLPELLKIGKILTPLIKGIMYFGQFMLEGVIGFITTAYAGYDALRESVEKFGGEDAVEKFDRLSDLLKAVINGAILAATLALVTSPLRRGFGGRGGGNVRNRNFGSNARTNRNINPNRNTGVTTGKGRFKKPESNTLKNLKKGIKPEVTNLGKRLRVIRPGGGPPIGFEFGKGTFSATTGRAPLIPNNSNLINPFKSLTSSADRTFMRSGPLSGIRNFATNMRNRIPFLNPNVSQGSNVVSRNLSKLNPFNKKVSVGGNALTRNLSKLNTFNKTVTTGMGGGGAPSGSKGLVGFLKNIRIPIPKWLTGWKGNALINTIFAAFEFRGRKKRGQSNLKAITGTGAGVAGGFAGFWAGAKIGSSIGAAIGAPFAGVGAGPGALIGGILGGIAGSMGGSALAGSGSDAIIDQIEKPNEQDFTKNIKSIDELSQNTSYSQGSYGLISEITTFIQPVIQEV